MELPQPEDFDFGDLDVDDMVRALDDWRHEPPETSIRTLADTENALVDLSPNTFPGYVQPPVNLVPTTTTTTTLGAPTALPGYVQPPVNLVPTAAAILDVAPVITERFHCDVPGCTHTSKTRRLLQQHKTRFHGTQRLKCDMCNKILKSNAHLYTHIQQVHNDTRKECPICSGQVIQRNYVRHVTAHRNKLGAHVTHRIRVAGNLTNQYACNLCGDATNMSLDEKNQHLQSHPVKDQRVINQLKILYKNKVDDVDNPDPEDDNGPDPEEVPPGDDPAIVLPSPVDVQTRMAEFDEKYSRVVDWLNAIKADRTPVIIPYIASVVVAINSLRDYYGNELLLQNQLAGQGSVNLHYIG